nr:hypothetical protein [Tanacetum cinerariifolium]
MSESEGSARGHWKLKPKNQKSSIKDNLSQPWVCEETDPFTPRICYFDFPKTRMPSHIKTYDGSEDIKHHLKIFQATAKTKHWAMPTWCHMFNSTLTRNARVWFDDLPKESIDSYDDLGKAFLENYLQQKKCIKDPIEIHNIKQRNGGIHGRVCEESMDEMMSVTAAFLMGEMVASNRERKKSFPSWKQEAGQKQNFKRGNFWNEQRIERKQDRFTLLTKTPREILALDKGKFKPSSPMTTPVEKRNAIKFCEFHGEVGHTTDECMHLKRQIEEMLKAGKLSHLIKELKQNHGKDQAKIAKEGETSRKDKPLAILMVQPWKKIASKFYSQIKNQLIPANTPLVGFSGEIIWPLGQISLLVRVGDEKHSTSARMNFMMVRSPSPYNGIIGRPRVRRIRAIPSITHRMIKFPVASGIVTLQSSRIIPLECSMVSEPVGCLPIRQKKKQQAPERNKAINEEVKKLVEADIMKEVHYHSWLSNPETKKKHDDSWRIRSIQRNETIDNGTFNVNITKVKEELIMYLAAAKEAISAVLMTERDVKQVPVYFVCHALQGPEINYTPMEKLILSLVSAREHDIQYRPRTSVKGQILVDFIVERPEDGTPDTPIEDREELLDP